MQFYVALDFSVQDNFSVASPLAELTKDEVREVSRELGLPNWNFAASPCLRSRLALNVEVSYAVK
jgi:pyridinium-3,5-biscarboxylic acid mononucleotide sulfurtransferase